MLLVKGAGWRKKKQIILASQLLGEKYLSIVRQVTGFKVVPFQCLSEHFFGILL